MARRQLHHTAFDVNANCSHCMTATSSRGQGRRIKKTNNTSEGRGKARHMACGQGYVSQSQGWSRGESTASISGNRDQGWADRRGMFFDGLASKSMNGDRDMLAAKEITLRCVFDRTQPTCLARLEAFDSCRPVSAVEFVSDVRAPSQGTMGYTFNLNRWRSRGSRNCR